MYVVCVLTWPDGSREVIRVYVSSEDKDGARREASSYLSSKYSPQSVEVEGMDDGPDKGWKLFDRWCEKVASKNVPAGAGAGQRQGKGSA
jgi:hypothetical protein